MWLLTASLLAGPALAQQGTTSGDLLTVGGTPEYYVVQNGDTLWEISARFLGNPMYWPRLWSINEQVTNPHWIYPGNRIVFRMGTQLEPPGVELEGVPSREGYTVAGLDYSETAPECGADVRFETRREAARYVAPGFLAEEDQLETYGTVYRARSQATHLGEGDLVYLDLENPDSFDCGDRVSIFRQVERKVRHPESRKRRYGGMYQVVGEAVVVHRAGDLLTAQLTRGLSEVLRGDLVGPAIPVAVDVDVRVPDGDLRGSVVANLHAEATTLNSVGETVFLDMGRDDGVRVGSTFYLIHQRDEWISLDDTDSRLPDSVVGRVVVVRVDDAHSTGVVVDASRTVEAGLVATEFVN
jgi:hypothetical protein